LHQITDLVNAGGYINPSGEYKPQRKFNTEGISEISKKRHIINGFRL